MKKKLKNIIVERTVNDTLLYINKGRRQGVKGLERVLIFKLGDEIFDNGKSLGRLEIPLGIFEVTKIEKNRSLLTFIGGHPFTSYINAGDLGKVINYVYE